MSRPAHAHRAGHKPRSIFHELLTACSDIRRALKPVRTPAPTRRNK
jgi:hypothetical protein